MVSSSCVPTVPQSWALRRPVVGALEPRPGGDPPGGALQGARDSRGRPGPERGGPKAPRAKSATLAPGEVGRNPGQCERPDRGLSPSQHVKLTLPVLVEETVASLLGHTLFRSDRDELHPTNLLAWSDFLPECLGDAGTHKEGGGSRRAPLGTNQWVRGPGSSSRALSCCA